MLLRKALGTGELWEDEGLETLGSRVSGGAHGDVSTGEDLQDELEVSVRSSPSLSSGTRAHGAARVTHSGGETRRTRTRTCSHLWAGFPALPRGIQVEV